MGPKLRIRYSNCVSVSLKHFQREIHAGDFPSDYIPNNTRIHFKLISHVKYKTFRMLHGNVPEINKIVP